MYITPGIEQAADTLTVADVFVKNVVIVKTEVEVLQTVKKNLPLLASLPLSFCISKLLEIDESNNVSLVSSKTAKLESLRDLRRPMHTPSLMAVEWKKIK